MGAHLNKKQKQARLDKALGCIVNEDWDHDDKVQQNQTFEKIESILQEMDEKNRVKDLEDCFKAWDARAKREEERKEFEFIEKFVLEEENLRYEKRREARKLEAGEEKRLAADIAKLKGFSFKSFSTTSDLGLQQKICEAERDYIHRKMLFARASQRAAGECRLQFARVRKFFESVHRKRLAVLQEQHAKTLRFQAIYHKLCGTDTRVVSLEQQITHRLYEKKKADLSELQMAQQLEEGKYLDSMMNMLDAVQSNKDAAATEMFELHVTDLTEQRDNDARRAEERELFKTAATKELAAAAALFSDREQEEKDNEAREREQVNAVERRRVFQANSSGNRVVSVNTLYDSLLWSVATSGLGLSDSDESSSLSSDHEGRTRMEEEDVFVFKSGESSSIRSQDFEFDAGMEKQLSPLANLRVKKLARRLRQREREMIERHDAEVREERQEHREAVNALRGMHQIMLDELLEECQTEQQNLRAATTKRMNELVKSMEASTEKLRQKDMELMKEAVKAEDRRIAHAETSSFAKAQELISAQVFHEVRNALSSVIAMKEITASHRKDTSLSPEDLITSVDDMMEQINDVVAYSLKMLNHVLDISKINSGAFAANIQTFDLQEVVARATRMQLPKKRRQVQMSFEPFPKPLIAVSDCDIVERIVATLLSNSVKFCQRGFIQPFVCPVEEIDPESNIDDGYLEQDRVDHVHDGKRLKLVAVGVADTGPGLSPTALRLAESCISTSSAKTRSHGASNTGFGLYHAHMQAKVLNSKLRLCTLDKCRGFLNEDLVSAMDRNHDEVKGTVLYLTIPVFEEWQSKLDNLKVSISDPSQSLGRLAAYEIPPLFNFSPRPSEKSIDGCFRILVADDVLMLRKGLVHTIGSVWESQFSDCPVSVSTACSAEEVLRATSAQPFDLIICDHLFEPVGPNIRTFSAEEISANTRPTIVFNANNKRDSFTKLIRQNTGDFFKNERFSVEEGDGTLRGLDALIQLAQSGSNNHCQDHDRPQFPTPVLMILSGHKLDTPPDLGIVVAQKPLKRTELVPLLEKYAPQLLETGGCVPCSDSNGGIILDNGIGSASGTASLGSGSNADSSRKTVLANRNGSRFFVPKRDNDQ